MAEDEKKETITGPAGAEPGLDLTTKPLLGIKLKKEVGVAAMILITVMIVGICYSLYHRGDVQHGGGGAAGAPNGAITAAGGSEADRIEHNLEKQRDEKLRAQAIKDGTVGADGTPISDGAPPIVVKGANGDTVRLPGSEQPGGGREGTVASGPPQPHVPTAAEIYQAHLVEAYNKALDSGTSASSSQSHSSSYGGGSGGPTEAPRSSADILKDAVSRYTQALQAGQGSGGGGAGGGGAAPGGVPSTSDQNQQDQKNAFAYQSSQKTDTLTTTRESPLSDYEIRAGWDIPATLDGTLNSDLPGNIKAIVRENVYDTATGKYLLIPQGSRLVGIYNSSITYGQARVQVVWSRLIYPDGTAVSLGNMPGVDVEGTSGFHDKVDNHFVRLIGSALLASAFAAGVELSQKQNQSVLATPSNGQIASQAIAQQMSQLGSTITNRNLSIQPTIIVRTGYRFNVRVTKDIVFGQPYTPLY